MNQINLNYLKNLSDQLIEKKFKGSFNLKKNDLIVFFDNYFGQINNLLPNDIEIKNIKLHEVTSIRRGDIIYLRTFGTAHYCLVTKTIEDKVFCCVMTSKEHEGNQLIKNDRIFKGSYVSTSVVTVNLEEAKKCFVRPLESKRELKRILQNLKTLYSQIF